MFLECADIDEALAWARKGAKACRTAQPTESVPSATRKRKRNTLAFASTTCDELG